MFISQLIRYIRACSSYECFILREARLLCKLLGQKYVKERWNRTSVLWSIWRYHQTLWSPPPASPKCYMTFWDMIIYSDCLHWPDISLNYDLVKPKSDIHCNRSATSPRPKFKTIAEVAEESQLGFAVGRRLIGDWLPTDRRPRGDLFATWCNWSPTSRRSVADQVNLKLI